MEQRKLQLKKADTMHTEMLIDKPCRDIRRGASNILIDVDKDEHREVENTD
jgi:hypothetical protein